MLDFLALHPVAPASAYKLLPSLLLRIAMGIQATVLPVLLTICF